MSITNYIFGLLFMALGSSAVTYGLIENAREYERLNQTQPVLWIKQSSMNRIINQPCDPNTIEHVGEYIRCNRRCDFEGVNRNRFGHPRKDI